MKIYLACPYSHSDEKIMQERFEAVNKKAGELMIEGHIVFSPISHSHPIQQTMGEDTGNLDFWMKQDMPFVESCDELWVMDIDGWDISEGVLREIAAAEKLGMDVWWTRP